MEMAHSERRFLVAIKGKGRYFGQSSKRRALNASFAMVNLMITNSGLKRQFLRRNYDEQTSSSILYFLHLVLKVLRFLIEKNAHIIRFSDNQSFGNVLSYVIWRKSFQLLH